MNLNELLVWLGTSGGSTMAVSWILEQIPSFQLLSSVAKKWIFFGMCLVLALGGYLILNFVPQETLLAIQPYFNIVIMVFVTNFIGEGFHKVSKKVEPEEEDKWHY